MRLGDHPFQVGEPAVDQHICSQAWCAIRCLGSAPCVATGMRERATGSVGAADPCPGWPGSASGCRGVRLSDRCPLPAPLSFSRQASGGHRAYLWVSTRGLPSSSYHGGSTYEPVVLTQFW